MLCEYIATMQGQCVTFSAMKTESQNQICLCMAHYITYKAVMILFFYISAIPVHHAAFGQGTGPILLHDVWCTGTESSLLNCNYFRIGFTSCSNFYFESEPVVNPVEGAGVICPPGNSWFVFKCHLWDSVCITTTMDIARLFQWGQAFFSLFFSEANRTLREKKTVM